MRRVTDACGRTVEVPAAPQRVVSLCPSLTETLAALGLAGRLVGRTRYCVHPALLRETVADVGGTKQLHLDRIQALQPDLIIAEKEENRREDVARLEHQCPVYVLDIRDISKALAGIETLGMLIARPAQATAMRQKIERVWRDLPALAPRRRVLYLIWRKPWMVVGADTYIDAVLDRLGLDNPARELEGRYPALHEDMLRSLDIDLCLLSSEPYPFTHEHVAEVQALLPAAAVACVDGEMFSWYGARMQPAAAYLCECVARWR